MKATNMKKAISITQMLLTPLVVLALLLAATASYAAAPGITGPNFKLIAQPASLTQPDGAMIYSWGYGCNGAPTGFAPSTIVGASCSSMQVPGPTLVVTAGQPVTVQLVNNLPAAAGNTSILFPGFNVAVSGGVAGLLTQEATPSASTACSGTSCVTYSFTATNPGTHSYYSGTQGDLQIEMGLYGAIIVLPATTPSGCTAVGAIPAHYVAPGNSAELDYRLAGGAYNNPRSCYDREYLFQFSEMDPGIHSQAQAQLAAITAKGGCTAGAAGCSLQVATEPYHPAYFMINGRSMPDDMDPNYAPQYPHQPYNGNPHMH